MKILIPIPRKSFDPVEASTPWRVLKAAGHQIIFTTPDGKPGEADPVMVTGQSLGLLKPLLVANSELIGRYHEMLKSEEFQNPISYDDIVPEDYDLLFLPGGHDKLGMREYLESQKLQQTVVYFFNKDKPVAAVCHGTLLVGRSIDPQTGKSVLYGRKTTGLRKDQEMSAWLLTCLWKGDYYRTYPQWMATELKSYLESPKDYIPGPMPLLRDSDTNLNPGFACRDGNYLSARWPGDIHRFSDELKKLLSN